MPTNKLNATCKIPHWRLEMQSKISKQDVVPTKQTAAGRLVTVNRVALFYVQECIQFYERGGGAVYYRIAVEWRFKLTCAV